MKRRRRPESGVKKVGEQPRDNSGSGEPCALKGLRVFARL